MNTIVNVSIGHSPALRFTICLLLCVIFFSNACMLSYNDFYDEVCDTNMQNSCIFDRNRDNLSITMRKENYSSIYRNHDFEVAYIYSKLPWLTTFLYGNITHFQSLCNSFAFAMPHFELNYDDQSEVAEIRVSTTQNTVTTTRVNNDQINQETEEEHKSYTIIYKDSPATTVLLIIIAVLLVIKVFGNKILHCFSQGGNAVNAPRDDHALRGRLNPEDEQMIQNNYVYLREQIEPLDIIAYLFQEKVLDRDDLEVIRNKLTRTERADTLLHLLLNAGPGKAFAVFMRALENQYGHVVKYIRNNG